MKYTKFGPLSTIKWALIDWNGNPNTTNIYNNLIKIFGIDQANKISKNIKSGSRVMYNVNPDLGELHENTKKITL